MGSFFCELKQPRVYRVALGCAIAERLLLNATGDGVRKHLRLGSRSIARQP